MSFEHTRTSREKRRNDTTYYFCEHTKSCAAPTAFPSSVLRQNGQTTNAMQPHTDHVEPPRRTRE